MTAQSWSGGRKGVYRGKMVVVSLLVIARSSGMLPLPWPDGPHVAGYQVTDSKQNKNKTWVVGGNNIGGVV